ncbi:MAG: S8 family serine peptidase [Solirubrobacteraceae bacterium]|nr:S8 family serine peptidase [Solirubrobacteraceae bacterium]
MPRLPSTLRDPRGHAPAGLRAGARLLGLAAVVVLLPPSHGFAASGGDAEIASQIVVRHRAAASAAERAEIRRDAGTTLDRRLRLTGVEVVEADGTRSDALAELRADPDVLWAEPNYPVTIAATNDPFWPFQYGFENAGTSGVADADVDIEAAWTVSRGDGITVGVVDTGIDAAHPDFAGQTVTGLNFAGDGHTTAADGHGHGTHVAGTIAARTDNGVGVAGGAPLAKVQGLRALNDSGSGSTASVAAAFDYAGDQGLRVVNASLGAPAPTNVERQAILEHPNTLFVVAAGNSGINVDGGGSTAYPCAYTYSNVLCVGASTSSDTAASFSNHGSTSVDLFAPGEQIASTYPGNSYVYMSGTSMASPLTAAAAALVASANPSWSAAQVKAALVASVDHPAGVANRSVTGGRLNAARALGVDVGPDGQAPPQLTGVVATPGAGKVDLSWTASTANDLQDYRVWRQVGGSWSPVETVTAPAASITGLADEEEVTVRVTARDRSGEESAPSATVVSAAAAAAPPAPTTPPATTPSPSTPEPAAPAPAPAQPAEVPPATSPEPAPNPAPPVLAPSPAPTPLPDLPELGLPTSPPDVAPAPAPGPAAQLTGLRTTKVRGRVRGVRFHLSAAAAVDVVATRRAVGRRAALTRRRQLELPAGPQHLPIDRSPRGLALAPGSWRVVVTAPSSRRTVAFTVR